MGRLLVGERGVVGLVIDSLKGWVVGGSDVG